MVKRFTEILNKNVGKIKSYKNIFNLTIHGEDARQLFLHFYKLNVPKLNRKWKNEIYQGIIQKEILYGNR